MKHSIPWKYRLPCRKQRLQAAFVLFLLTCCLFTLWGNPFLGAPEEAPARVTAASQTDPELVEKQMDLRNRMADLFLSLEKGQSPKILSLLLGIAFLYGMLHAAGPGHRKTVVFSLYLSREARWHEPLALGTLLSLLHGGSAVLLILLFKSTMGPLLSQRLDSATLQMEGWAYTLLMILSLLLLASAVKHNFSRKRDDNNESGRSFWAIALTGFFPCPGAIMILIFTLTQNMLPAGIAAIAAMSAGMALPVSLAGYLAYFGKKGIFTVIKRKEKLMHNLSASLEITGFSLLFLFSLFMSYPFFTSFLT